MSEAYTRNAAIFQAAPHRKRDAFFGRILDALEGMDRGDIRFPDIAALATSLDVNVDALHSLEKAGIYKIGWGGRVRLFVRNTDPMTKIMSDIVWAEAKPA
tara:strand:- start:164 stop:466 length:303 start_codon:yes stop_codon:yes gene_type:complete